MLDFGVPVAAGSVGGLEQLEVAVGSEPTVEAVDHAAGTEVCNTVSSSPSSGACGQPGYGGGGSPPTRPRVRGARPSPTTPARWPPVALAPLRLCGPPRAH